MCVLPLLKTGVPKKLLLDSMLNNATLSGKVYKLRRFIVDGPIIDFNGTVSHPARVHPDNDFSILPHALTIFVTLDGEQKI